MFNTMNECTEFIFTLKAVDHKRAPLVLMKEVLAHLENPHNKLRVIHVAGSNGKGSTVNALREMLQHTGHQVGAFTSPHLERVNERMTINGEPITDEQFLYYFNKLAKIIEEQYNGDFPSFFEVVTLIMFQFFADQEIDIALIETGLGGRLDATNVVTPLLAIITTISLEHTAFLGDTFAKIASEKAGIIKRGVPVVVGVSNEEALAVIKETADAQQAPCFILGQDFTVSDILQGTDVQQFTYEKGNIVMTDIALKMAGPHQINNASLAITAILALREGAAITISDSSIRYGLRYAHWAGRFEQWPQKIVLDGAHNSEGTAALIQTLKNVFPKSHYRFVYAALADKDHANSIALMDDVATSIAFTQINLPNAMPAEDLVVLSTNADKSYYEDWLESVQTVLRERAEEDIVVITGSLYFIAGVRQWLQEEGR
ncbi:dihydrofolate synthase / folylpolyglutamate synthase [Lysinibacillus fusiformis]|nr:dihydrofolate synthase / folylpolyglutamate synthase [Lysinibacillus fusiformis]SDB47366.1 dihydrofolate synthase / folylpolyglutamate synthase [Lysinibacillus fusiformis]SFI77336.1 dihydrofolate synthase / folylpolyglutamate synthase [Lysinibacillus fusiformis]SFT17344.1 dihydrofolate synthase / folylpolyglutamate synthase [Lysinibacillus fusiformis]